MEARLTSSTFISDAKSWSTYRVLQHKNEGLEELEKSLGKYREAGMGALSSSTEMMDKLKKVMDGEFFIEKQRKRGSVHSHSSGGGKK